jgi:hypothetical protein
MEFEEISDEEFESYQSSRKSYWKQVIEHVKTHNKPIKVSDLTRGQVAAGYRAAQEAGLRVKANYKDGFLLIAP